MPTRSPILNKWEQSYIQPSVLTLFLKMLRGAHPLSLKSSKQEVVATFLQYSKLFEAQPIALSFYGAQLGPFSKICPIRMCSVQISKIGPSSPKMDLQCNPDRPHEIGGQNMVTIFNYWSRLFFFLLGFASLTIWKKKVATKISSLGFFPGLLLSMGYDQVKALIKQHVVDIQFNLLTNSPIFIVSEPNSYSASPISFGLIWKYHQRAFTLA